MVLLSPSSSQANLSLNKSISTALKKGLSVKVFGLPGTGKTAVFSWLAKHPLKSILPQAQFVYLELEQLSTPLGKKKHYYPTQQISLYPRQQG